LDETDAALDESNSLRYGEMLKNLSRTTQIITITHNRGTMRQAGSLYGITMGSDGVSRLLSLKLTEAEEIVK
jgi:chromosome segregation protein